MRNQQLNTGAATFYIHVKMLLVLNQVQVTKKIKFKIQIMNMGRASVQVRA